MALNQEEFDTFVKSLESFARQKPGTYKIRVGLLAVLGYAYIFLVLLGLLAAFGLIVLIVVSSQRINAAIIKIGILLLIPTIIVLRSLWVSFPPPAGLALSRQDVPRLFDLVDELTSNLQAPRFHHILLTEDFNAAVVQRPRLGILGWQENYLIVGLPLMQALSPEQFRAVLAHELGHLSGNHSRFAGWIYRVRKTYAQLLERLQQSGQDGSSVLFNSFFNWYAPFFGAYSFVLARMDEYEADRCASQLAGPKNTAQALINVEVQARFLESSFWPSVYKQVDHEIEPPPATFSRMFTALQTDVKSQEASKWLEEALSQTTSYADTHPCLADRLSALGCLPKHGQPVSLPTPVNVSAAEKFLGDAVNKFTDYFDSNWREQVATPWRQRYAYAQETLQSLQALEEKAQKQPLTDEEAWNRASWTLEFKGEETGIPLLREILTANPEHAAANYTLGQILLQKEDAKGIEHIEKAIAKDPEGVIPGCELIYFFLKQQGQLEQAKLYQERGQQHYELLAMAQQERSFATVGDEFQPHNLPDAAVQEISQQLSAYDRLKAAYLVQKVVKYFPEKPFYVLGVTRKTAFSELDRTQGDNELVNRIANEVQFPGHTYIIILNDDTRKLGKMLRQVERATIYQK